VALVSLETLLHQQHAPEMHANTHTFLMECGVASSRAHARANANSAEQSL